MIIEKCHIDNFGKMSDFDIEFKEGLNIINHDNSWGKTTLSDFIKAMLFGLEYNTKKTNERKKYEPWQGGTFGGSVVIDIDGTKYRIERTFGKKNKDDTFSLYNLTTGKESTDYDENIGEKLFEIDRDSYAKSVYIPQCSIKTEMTDEINANIGDLYQAKDDISEYEKVKKSLELKKKDIAGQGKNSKLKILKAKMSEHKSNLEQKNSLMEATGKIEEYIKRKKAELDQTKEKLNNYRNISDSQNEKMRELTLYQNALSEIKKSEEKIKQIKAMYNNRELNKEDIELMKNEQGSITMLDSQIKQTELSDKEKEKYAICERMFKDNIPSDSYFSETMKYIDKAKELRLSLQTTGNNSLDDERFIELKKYFDGKLPTETEAQKQIENYSNSESLKNQIAGEKSSILERKVASENAKEKIKNKGVFILAGAILIVISILLALITKKYVLFIVSLLGLALVVVPLLTVKDNKNNKDLNTDVIFERINQLEEKQKQYENSYMEFIRQFKVTYSDKIINVLMEIRDNCVEYARLERNIKERNEQLKEYVSKLNEKIHLAVKNLSIYDDEISVQVNNLLKDVNNYESIISEINGSYKKIYDYSQNFNQLKQKKENFELYTNRKKQHMIAFENAAVQYGITLDRDFSKVRFHQEQYVNEVKRMDEHQKIAVDCRKKIQKNEAKGQIYSPEQLKQYIYETDEKVKEILEDINRYQRDLEGNYNKLEMLDGIEETIEKDNALLEEYKKKAGIIEETLLYLQEAKESFSARYLGTMRQSFSNYLNMINGLENANIDVNDLDIDIELNATLSNGGTSKSVDSLSRGYQDLTAFCIRLSLVDAMYTNEKPILVLDDPFVNLDETKINNAMDIIRNIGEKYQIIYFTCHSSRA